MKMSRLALAFLIVAQLASLGFALDCYVCTTASPSNCEAGSIDARYSATCLAGQDFCKVVTSFGVSWRTCESSDGGTGCFLGSCWRTCNTDNCNTGSGADAATFIVAIASLLQATFIVAIASLLIMIFGFGQLYKKLDKKA